MKFHGEIQYESPNGNVHSDICFSCNPETADQEITAHYRRFLHACLDEWLDNSNGTGAFWVGDYKYFNSWKEEQ
jgi:hypothetical protein